MPAPAKRTVVLYGRPGCHLCDHAESGLRALEPRLNFATRVVNIEDDPGLHRRFLYEIPVIEHNGHIVARAPINPGTLEDLLRAVLAEA